MFIYLFEVALVNTRIIYSTLNPTIQLNGFQQSFASTLWKNCLLATCAAMSDLVDLLLTPHPFACRDRTTTLSSQSLASIQNVRDCMVCSNTPLAGSSKGARHRSSYECSEFKKALCIYPCFKWFHSLTVYKAECTEAFHSLPQVPVESGVEDSSKTHSKALDISSLKIYPLLCSSIYPSVAISQWLSSFQNQTVICQETDHLSLSTTSSTAAGP